MPRYIIWKPIIEQEEKEPFVELKYKDLTIEIPYTVIHLWAGWLAIGMHGCRGWDELGSDTHKLFHYLQNVMGWDANPPSVDAINFYESHHIPCDRAELQWDIEPEDDGTRKETAYGTPTH